MWQRVKRWMDGYSDADAQPHTAVTAVTPVTPDGARGLSDLRILMVCSGNICRSPTAEGVLRAKLQRAGLQGVHVDSAGTHGFHVSEPPDPRAQAAAKRRGYDLARLRARPVTPDDYVNFHWLLAMDRGHMDWMQENQPAGFQGQIQLLMAHARKHPGVKEVPDPYYGSPLGFELVLDLVEDACDGLVESLLARPA